MREPINELKGALRSYLLADGTIAAKVGAHGVYEDGNHREEALPLIVYRRVGGGSERVLGNGRTAVRSLFSIKAIAGGTGGSKVAGEIASRIDVLLDGETFAIASPFTVDSITEVAPIDYAETADGELYSHIGASFEIWVTGAA